VIANSGRFDVLIATAYGGATRSNVLVRSSHNGK
jgi:hypothetical protein